MPIAKKSPRIVFMGTPDFAVASADALWNAGVEFASVVTTPDRAAGRGLRVRQSAVKQWALQHAVPVLQPEELSSPEFLQALQQAKADLFIVVAFRILPREVFAIPPMGTINLHASLLPKFRGAAPINWAIIEGETETGVTTFLIDGKIDTGDILLQRKVPIGEDETYGELYERLKIAGAELLVETVKQYVAGEIVPQKQVGTASRAPKITPEICRIDWQWPATKIRNLVRGLSPTPAAFTTLNQRRLKIFRCRVVAAGQQAEPGCVLAADARTGRFVVQAGEGAIQLDEVQLEGKKRLPAADFLRGYPVSAGDVCK